ncbi:YdbL family protein [Sneathiella aquimaris]|uniref:YdbL family protein n=1 Tax=Sneathiella aquimaris TaxID=2599305 RepID=UPI00146E8407|nr:DUF1318 domain-containing protein [Sneathiella aquimaris]
MRETNTKITRRKFATSVLSVSVLLAGLAIFPSSNAHADDLDTLRASGAVGEAYDGYARARKDSAAGFVSEVNSKRRSIYVARAKSQGVSAEQVGRVYANQIAGSAPAGTWFLAEDGSWSQK